MTRRDPPYWPYRCRACSRFVANPRVWHNAEHITRQVGDCGRCGPDVPLVPLGWDDWFPDDYDPLDAILATRQDRTAQAVTPAPDPPASPAG